jgi:hypothetical protein
MLSRPFFGGCGDPLVTRVSVAENKVVNNDGIYLENFGPDPSCTVSTNTRTGNVVTRNQISNSAVTSTSGPPDCAYQAGVQDQAGNHDVIDFNHISGAGYLNHPTCTAGQPYTTFRIDTTGAIDPHLVLELLTGQSR